MRQVVSLSIPSKQAVLLRKMAIERGYRSVSHYISCLIQEDADLISEEELLKAVKLARMEYRRGKSIRAKSLDDLI